MAFPDDIEPNIGLAGPTADIGHAAAHAASGAPRMFQAIQETIGIYTGTQIWQPTWADGGTPSTNNVSWNRVGNQVAVSVEFRWTTGGTSSSTFRLFSDWPAGWISFKEAVIPGRGQFGNTSTVQMAYLYLRQTSGGNANIYSFSTANSGFPNRTSFVNGNFFIGSGVIVVA